MCVWKPQKFQKETFLREKIANMNLHLKLVWGHRPQENMYWMYRPENTLSKTQKNQQITQGIKG